MKNDDQMYQSVLSRYAEYQETKKKQRRQTIRRTVPVLACFCFCAVLGLGYWKHFRNLPSIPVQPDYIDETTLETPETTTSTVPESASTTLVSDKTEPASTTAPVFNSETERMTTTAGVQTQTVTTVVTDATEAPATEQAAEQTEAPASVETEPVTEPQLVTEPPVVTTVDSQAPIVTEPITTTDPESPAEPPDEPISWSAEPLSFRNITDMKDAIQNKNVSSYYEEYQEQYRIMFERFHNDGFFYLPVTDEVITFRPDYSTLLYPYERFRDIGIKYCLTYNGEVFDVYFYCADIAVVNKTNGIAEYLDMRKGVHNDIEYSINDLKYSIHVSSDGRELGASRFVDDGHYCTVVANTSEEMMKEFLSLFRYEQILL